jgi:hypothetical protein
MPSGGLANGLLQFQVQVYEEGDEGAVLGRNGKRPPSARDWLQRANAKDKIVVTPPPQTPTAPPVEVPAEILRAVPPDALVVMEWEWRRLG